MLTPKNASILQARNPQTRYLSEFADLFFYSNSMFVRWYLVVSYSKISYLFHIIFIFHRFRIFNLYFNATIIPHLY